MGSVVLASGGGSYDEFRLDNALEFADGVDEFADLLTCSGDGYHRGRTVFFQREARHAEHFRRSGIQCSGELGFDAGNIQVAQYAYGADDGSGNGTQLAGQLFAYHIPDEFGTVAVTGLRQKFFQLFIQFLLNGKTHSDK